VLSFAVAHDLSIIGKQGQCTTFYLSQRKERARVL
jgi:hypothetical protein